jgi:hypothetical protein
MGDVVTGYNRHPAFAFPHDIEEPAFGLATPTLWEVPMVLRNRISTKTLAGAAESVPASYAFGEAIELRYSSALVDTQFQGLFLQVDTSVANSSTIRAAEFTGRRASGAAVAVGLIMGVQSVAYTASGATGNIGNLFGFSAEAQVDAAYTGTIALFAGARVKLQVEDGATYTRSYGVLVEHEAVTGGKVVDAAFGAKSAAGAAFTALIDAVDATLAATDGDKVTLIKFKDSAGATKSLVYDESDGTTSVV